MNSESVKELLNRRNSVLVLQTRQEERYVILLFLLLLKGGGGGGEGGGEFFMTIELAISPLTVKIRGGGALIRDHALNRANMVQMCITSPWFYPTFS